MTEIDEDAILYNVTDPIVYNQEEVLDYNDNILRKINDSIRSTVLAKLKNDPDINEILKLLNSAPANLRYGYARANVQIQAYVDPMGNDEKELTYKEKAMLYATHTNRFGNNGDEVENWDDLWQEYYKYFKDTIVPAIGENYIMGTHYDGACRYVKASGDEFFNEDHVYTLSCSQAHDIDVDDGNDKMTFYVLYK